MPRDCVSVVIPSRNGATRLPETLAAIAAQETSSPVEIVVVDDASTDATHVAARAVTLPWGSPRIVRKDAAGGRAAACNAGIDAATGSVVVILDDDMTLRPGALEAHRAFHASRPAVVALGRMVLAPPARETCFTRFLSREEERIEQRLLASRESVPFSLCRTGHFSATGDVLRGAGCFEASITRYGFEDIELGYRLSRRGVRLAYLPEAVSVHRAYMTDLNRYVERHREAGLVARQLAALHPEGAFREYLRVDGPERLGAGSDPAGLVALRLVNRLLLVAPLRRALGSRPGFAALRGALRVAEALRLERLAHFGYHVARDVRYFQGYFSGGDNGGGRVP